MYVIMFGFDSTNLSHSLALVKGRITKLIFAAEEVFEHDEEIQSGCGSRLDLDIDVGSLNIGVVQQTKFYNGCSWPNLIVLNGIQKY